MILTIATTLLKALIESPLLGSAVNAFLGQLFLVWMSYQNDQNSLAIMQAARKSLDATTKEDRIEALNLWRNALSRRSLK